MLLLLVVYEVYFWLWPRGVVGVLLGFVPGALGMGMLLVSGFTPGEMHLRLRPSRQGLWILAAETTVLAVIYLGGPLARAMAELGFEWEGILPSYALESVLSGIHQELYFRAALLPALRWTFGGRLRLVLAGQTVLFTAWHFPLFPWTPLAMWIPIAAVLLLVGLVWGWQVWQDCTVAWAMAQHSLVLFVLSLYGFA